MVFRVGMEIREPSRSSRSSLWSGNRAQLHISGRNVLPGVARRHLVGKRPDWVSFDGGVRVLLDYARRHLGLPQVPEMTEYLSRYFKHGRRRRGESMGEYITRKSELYARTRQSMARVLQSKSASSGTSQTAGSASSWGREQWNRWYSRGRWWTTWSDHWPSDTVFHVPEEEETEVQDEAEHAMG